MSFINVMADTITPGDIIEIGSVSVRVTRTKSTISGSDIWGTIGGVKDEVSLLVPNWMPLTIERPNKKP